MPSDHAYTSLLLRQDKLLESVQQICELLPSFIVLLKQLCQLLLISLVLSKEHLMCVFKSRPFQQDLLSKF